MDKRALGALGEDLAARYLRRRGYRILARNIRAGGVELDLIVQRFGLLAFVEVKTRRGAMQGPPEAAVDARKQRRIVQGAQAWLQAHDEIRPRRLRFDVVSVAPDARGRLQTRHLPGAFDAGAD